MNESGEKKQNEESLSSLREELTELNRQLVDFDKASKKGNEKIMDELIKANSDLPLKLRRREEIVRKIRALINPNRIF